MPACWFMGNSRICEDSLIFEPRVWLLVCSSYSIMATSPVIPSNSSVEPVKLPVGPLMIAVVVGIVVATAGAGGVIYLLARSGRLPVPVAAIAKPEPAGASATHAVVLESLLVNLADSGGNAYLRVGITLRVADVAEKSGAKKDEKAVDKMRKDDEAAIRDTALEVLGRQNSEGLLAPDGKEKLKADLKAAMAKHNTDLKIEDLFFTEFLVQR
jgi:flagellar FliL protein